MARSLVEVAAEIDRLLHAERFAGLDDPNGVWRPTERPVATLGLALAPDPAVIAWAEAERLDALWLHRPWDLLEAALPGIGVLAHHLAFDERLTTGFNPDLAAVLGMGALEVLGRKGGRPLGMVGEVGEEGLEAFRLRLAAEFEGAAELRPGAAEAVRRVAVVGAMWPELIEAAAARGVDLYVTGTFRERARPAVEATGMAVAVVGHAPPERWGARRLAALVGAALSDVRVVVEPGLRRAGGGGWGAGRTASLLHAE